MGARLKNEFSWSFSRVRGFNSCARYYYWNYYGSWEGWLPEAPEQARMAYRLKKIVPLPMWSGDIVHRAIAETLNRIMRYQRVDAEGMKQWARAELNRQWFQSIEERWRQNAKYNFNLFEHYYEREISVEQRTDLRDGIFRCIDNFFDSAIFKEACELGCRRWKQVETLSSFFLEDIKVFLQIDFAFERPDGSLVIADWKSGKESDQDEQQLYCYALYAFQEWKTPVDQIRLIPAYLANGSAEERPVDPARLMEVREMIYQSAAAMRKLLDDPVDNSAKIDHFELTNDTRKCEFCQFLELCHGRDFALGGGIP